MHLDTLQRLLQRATRLSSGGPAPGRSQERETFLSWAAIAEKSAVVAGGLAELGVRPGERVALVYPTSAEFFHAFFGVLLAGAVPVPLYPPVRLGRLAEYHARTAAMLAAAGARLLLADRRVHALLGETLAAGAPARSAAARSTSCRRTRNCCATALRRTWRWCSSPPAPPSSRSRWRFRSARSWRRCGR